MQIARALSPSAMLVAVQYSVSWGVKKSKLPSQGCCNSKTIPWITLPSNAVNYEPVNQDHESLRQGRTYYKRLIPCEHDNKFDAKKFSKRTTASEFIFGQAVE